MKPTKEKKNCFCLFVIVIILVLSITYSNKKTNNKYQSSMINVHFVQLLPPLFFCCWLWMLMWRSKLKITRIKLVSVSGVSATIVILLCSNWRQFPLSTLLWLKLRLWSRFLTPPPLATKCVPQDYYNKDTKHWVGIPWIEWGKFERNCIKSIGI